MTSSHYMLYKIEWQNTKNNKMPSYLFDKDCSEDQNVKIGKRVIQLIYTDIL